MALIQVPGKPFAVAGGIWHIRTSDTFEDGTPEVGKTPEGTEPSGREYNWKKQNVSVYCGREIHADELRTNPKEDTSELQCPDCQDVVAKLG